MTLAVAEQLKWEEQGLPGYSSNALDYFGRALHTKTDADSPWHHHWKGEWAGPYDPGASFAHAAGEFLLGPSREAAIGMAELDARALWGQFQMQLTAERKRKEAEQKRKDEAAVHERSVN